MNTQDIAHDILLNLADEIEAEMRRLGLWGLTGAAELEVAGAFGAGAMTFEEWLQRIFLPNLKEAAQNGFHPQTSSVATAAVRNLDGVDDVARLIELLAAVDRAVELL
jgi:uncharacterized protein YqcC (DUF446 family)